MDSVKINLLFSHLAPLITNYLCPADYMQIGEIMKVELVVDGNRIPLNRFVQQILGAGVKGMVETLDSVDTPWRALELKIEQDKE